MASGTELADGDYIVPPGKVAMVVTHLEQTAPPERSEIAPPQGVRLAPWQGDAAAYVRLFREIGTPWLWFGRLLKTPQELTALFADPCHRIYAARRGDRAIGLLELAAQSDGNVEIAYFGLVPGETGRGAGRWLMDQAQRLAWSAPGTRRLWVHTCTADDPAAPAFYRKMGFTAFARGVEVADDPRLSGLHTRDAGPEHLPVIAPPGR